jgi:hypothetical protein
MAELLETFATHGPLVPVVPGSAVSSLVEPPLFNAQHGNDLLEALLAVEPEIKINTRRLIKNNSLETLDSPNSEDDVIDLSNIDIDNIQNHSVQMFKQINEALNLISVGINQLSVKRQNPTIVQGLIDITQENIRSILDTVLQCNQAIYTKKYDLEIKTQQIRQHQLRIWRKKWNEQARKLNPEKVEMLPDDIVRYIHSYLPETTQRLIVRSRYRMDTVEQMIAKVPMYKLRRFIRRMDGKLTASSKNIMGQRIYTIIRSPLYKFYLTNNIIMLNIMYNASLKKKVKLTAEMITASWVNYHAEHDV